MKHKMAILMLLLLTSSFFMIGCDDDDDDVIAAASIQGYILGRANLYNSSYSLSLDIMPVGTIELDSVNAFDTTAKVEVDYWYVYGDNNYWYAYTNQYDTSLYHSGDTVSIAFYEGTDVTSTVLTLLNYYNDDPQTILPVDNDSLSLGSAVSCVWNSVENADWYGIRTRYQKDSAGTQVYTYKYYSTTDTTLTIPGAQNIYNGYYDIYIIAASGPLPKTSFNIDGLGYKGEIYSYTTYQDGLRVYMGTGDPTPVGDSPDDNPDTEINIADEIMNSLTGLRKQAHVPQ